MVNTTVDSQKVLDAVTKVHNSFGLSGQGKEFVTLISRFLKSPGVSLFFLDELGDKFEMLAGKPVLRTKQLAGLELDTGDKAVKQLFEAGQVLETKNPLAKRLFTAISSKKNNSMAVEDIDLIIPVVSNERPIGMVFIDKKDEDYTQEEIDFIDDISVKLAPGLEKEYLRDRLSRREQELMVLNSCCGIISSSFDISGVFDTFTDELKKLMDVDWAAILLIEDDNMMVLSSYSNSEINWEPGETMPVKGTATGWVAINREPLVESDLKNDSLFVTDIYHLNQGIRSIVCVPLLVNREEVIGSMVVGSNKPEAYNPKQVEFLRTVATRIAMPVKNARLYDEVLKKSRYDELTGLLNRRSMDEQIEMEVSRHSRYGGVFSLIFLDLDSMKYINDHYGHLAGDGILARTGGVIKKSIRGVDQAFRYGGDEFAILLPNTTAEAAVKVSERVRKQLAAKLVVDDMTVTASFGLASWPENAVKANDLVAAADAALYIAKSQGGNRSCFSDNLQ